jgi:hypothetical protein
MDQSTPDHFFDKLKNESHTKQDYLEFRAWLDQASESKIQNVLDGYGRFFENIKDEHEASSGLKRLIEKKLDDAEVHEEAEPYPQKPFVRRFTFKKAISVAAILSIVFLLHIFIKPNSQPVFTNKVVPKPGEIVPGSNKAVLTLANGNTIMLDSAKNGVLASQNQVRILKSKTGQLIYDASGYLAKSDDQLSYNTIAVPRGGQYQIVLPDGSKVWLNAESSLRYPAHFAAGDRVVELTGEAYFEVAKDRLHPFKISINNMQVQVLGTHFNIMGYKDEEVTKTTLLEGSVKIIKGSAQQKIVPGQQAIVNDNIKIATVNVEEAVEWKNGNFNFSHEGLETIMRKISRWYDVDISYRGKTTKAVFVGTLPRSKNINDVLKYLELTGLVHFKIEERRVTAMP